MESINSSRFLCLIIWIFCWIATPFGFDGMENRYAAQAISLAKEGAFTIDSSYKLSIDVAKVGDHFFPAAPPGLPLLGSPIAWAAKHLHALLPAKFREQLNETVRNSSQFYQDQHEDLDIGHFLATLILLRLFFAAPVACFLALGLLRLLRDRHPKAQEWSLAGVVLIVLLGTNLAFYLPRFYAHAFTACLLVWTTAWALDPKPLDGKKAFFGGLFAASLPLVDYPYALGAIFVGFLFLGRRPSRKLFGLALLGASLPLAIFMAYHAYFFGGPLTLAHQYIVGFKNHHHGYYGLTVPSLNAVLRTLFSPDHGFFLYAFLLIPAVPRMDRTVLALFVALPPDGAGVSAIGKKR